MSGLIINHNIMSMFSLSAMNTNQSALQSSMQKLSTGKQVNTAADDAAGFAISQKMQSQINGLNQASQNSQDGISMLQTADGALSQTQDILQRMRTLAMQASNGTNTTSDIADIGTEVTQLQSQIDSIAQQTAFNGQNLLNGNSTVTLQVGANAGESMVINFTTMNTTALTVDAANVTITDYASAQTALTNIDNAIQAVNTQLANFGAYENRLNYTVNNLSTSSNNLTSAQSGITDTNMASEMANFTKNNVLQQAAVSMLAQANQQPQLVLKLLG
ncbi:flagellin N-terminal helical domain-containing protein [Alicyclobacillus dauci]|uniref:Flagellin n=1 Tax=Alicyclobacillus dauci TaxID=1475485 RepID=A0ABY6Z4V5_9BACL|nr:flagellin [Alicyclobacillus dauci]WAH37687.1 flagellin [Alicyclobacillus dauci]